MKLSQADLEKAAEMSEGLAGSDVESACRKARLAALQEHLSVRGVDTVSAPQGLPVPTFAELKEALREILLRSHKSSS